MSVQENAEGPFQDRDTEMAHAKRVSLALAAGSTGVWSWDPESASVTWDDRVAAIWGIADGEMPRVDQFFATINVSDRPDASKAIENMKAGSVALGSSDVEFRIARFSDGKERWIAARGQAFRNEAGAIVEIIGTVRDVTDTKLHEIHLQMLLREITHRSKNLLAIIQAMARQTVKDSLTAEDFEQRLSLRLQGLAASHELLAAQDWHGAHMEELVKGQLRNVLETYVSRVTLDGPSLFVKPEAAQNIGLALNELATNAIRFGALSNDVGRVGISWAFDDAAGTPSRLRITWTEDGGPTVEPPRRQGFGHKVVERVAARALDGSVSLTFAPSGLKWSLHIPVSFVLSGQPASSPGMPQFF